LRRLTEDDLAAEEATGLLVRETVGPRDAVPASGLVIGLRGCVPSDIRERAAALGVSSSDISSMFNAAKRPLQAIVRLIDRQERQRNAGITDLNLRGR